jgi:hypothetical protein
MYAQANANTNGESERSIARVFYFVSKEVDPTAIKLIDSMVGKLADYLQDSRELIREGMLNGNPSVFTASKRTSYDAD